MAWHPPRLVIGGKRPSGDLQPGLRWLQRHLAAPHALPSRIDLTWLPGSCIDCGRGSRPHPQPPSMAASGAPAGLQDVKESKDYNFPEEEEAILQLWKELDAFKEQLRRTEGKPEFSFYDGPPFATGMPHYGHLLAGTLKVGAAAAAARMPCERRRQAATAAARACTAAPRSGHGAGAAAAHLSPATICALRRTL